MITLGLFATACIGVLLAAAVYVVAKLTFNVLRERIGKIINKKCAVIESTEIVEFLKDKKKKGKMSLTEFEKAMEKYSKPSVVLADMEDTGDVKKAEQIVYKEQDKQLAGFISENGGVIMVENDL